MKLEQWLEGYGAREVPTPLRSVEIPNDAALSRLQILADYDLLSLHHVNVEGTSRRIATLMPRVTTEGFVPR